MYNKPNMTTLDISTNEKRTAHSQSTTEPANAYKPAKTNTIDNQPLTPQNP
jgi:hypothetical protein